MEHCEDTRETYNSLSRMKVSDIKDMMKISELPKWFFTATLLTSPQTRVVEDQIRQALFVFDPQEPEKILVVVLTEPAVRKYCNMLRPFSQIKFINGTIKKSHLDNIYVLITKQSTLEKIFDKDVSSKQNMIQGNKDQSRENAPEEFNEYTIKPKSQVFGNIEALQVSQDRSKIRSQKIEVKRQSNLQLITFCGTVLVYYKVGKGKVNHGLGYKISECFSGLQHEVVIWSDLPCNRLKVGASYQFNNFKVHIKPTSQISYHSHSQYSIVTQLK